MELEAIKVNFYIKIITCVSLFICLYVCQKRSGKPHIMMFVYMFVQGDTNKLTEYAMGMMYSALVKRDVPYDRG